MAADLKKCFRWRAVTPTGEVVRGVRVARDKDEIRQFLATQDVIPITVAAGGRVRRLGGRDVTALLRQLATLLHATLPIGDVFDLLRRQAPPRLQRTLTLIWQDIETGGGLAQSIAPYLHPRHRYVFRILQAGEDSGRLAELASELASQREKHEKIHKKLKRAATYPLTVLIASGAVVTLLLLTMMPQFESFYADFGGELPASTQLTLRLFSVLSEHGAGVAAALALSGAGFALLHRGARWFRFALAYMVLRLPFAGTLKKAYLCRLFATVVAPAYAAGVPLATAIEWLEDATSDPVFGAALERVSARLEEGMGFSEAIRSISFFDHFFRRVIRIGENSGRLGEALRQITEFYDERIAAISDRIIQLTEPLLILLIAGTVGWIVATMYLPIFNLGFAL